MRARFRSEFERRLAKQTRKHCDKIHTLGCSSINYWQYVYAEKAYFSTFDIYDQLVKDGKIQPFPDSIIDDHLGL